MYIHTFRDLGGDCSLGEIPTKELAALNGMHMILIFFFSRGLPLPFCFINCPSAFLFFITSLLEDNCFTMVC